jgi:trimeric autotransporter adhesin
MLHASRLERLFLLGVTCLLAVSAALAQSPALTTVSDTVYRADGSPPSGTLLISWPAFTTADGYAVVAGTKSVVLGSGGSFSVQLAPNAGGTPGVAFSVVYQLSDGTVKSEVWTIGNTSPQTVAQVRTMAGTSAAAGQLATQQFANAALTNVVHISGNETITGTKQFAVAPVLPSPTQAGQAVNKAYVDASVAGTAGGSFVAKSGFWLGPPFVSRDLTECGKHG